MAFLPFNPGTGADHSVILPVIIANSSTIAAGDVVDINSSGFAVRATATQAVLGIAIGFTTDAGTPIPPTAYAAGSATGTDVTSVASASDNQTVAQRRVLVETSPFKRWSAQVNGTMNTTGVSNQPGTLVNVDSGNSNWDRVLETSNTRDYSVIRNFYGWGADPNDSTRQIVSLASPRQLRPVVTDAA